MVSFAPSILAADMARLREEVARIPATDWLHLDVMDGHFVPNLTFGAPVARALVNCQSTPVEAHLMVWEPEKMIGWFVEAGCRRIIAHAEATPHLHRAVQMIKKEGREAGVALNPGTPIHVLDYLLDDLDLVLAMTVDPGFGAQKMIPAVLAKIADLRRTIERRSLGCRIEVDGGINAETIPQVVAAGADTLVIGNALFGAPDPAAAMAQFQQLVQRPV